MRPSDPRTPASAGAPDPALHFDRWILFEDSWLIAVDKPAGVLSQGGEGGAGINLVDLAREYSKIPKVGVLHRLDRNVSGVVLLSKDGRVAAALSRDFERGAVDRRYEAIVRVLREPESDSFVVDAPLAKDEKRNEVRAVTKEALAQLRAALRADFKESRTEAAVLQRFSTPMGLCALVGLRPITGRSHQLRVHMAHAGLPIVGDPKYGVLAQGLSRPLLHARTLRFTHPRTKSEVTLEAPPPFDAAGCAGLRAAGSATVRR